MRPGGDFGKNVRRWRKTQISKNDFSELICTVDSQISVFHRPPKLRK
jgi:hypothetical protein